MKWPHKVAIWEWNGDASVFEIPCQVSDYSTDKLLPPSEYEHLGRQQERLISYRIRCPLWVYPFVQELAPIAITPSSSERNPFGRDFVASSKGENLFITDLSIQGGILDLVCDSLVTNPLGLPDAKGGLFIPTQPVQPLPDKPIELPRLQWYWLPVLQQPDPLQWNISTGYPNAMQSADIANETVIPIRAKLLFVDSVLNPLVDIRSAISIQQAIIDRYKLPADYNQFKISVLTTNNTLVNFMAWDASEEEVVKVSYTDTDTDGVTVGVLGFEIETPLGWTKAVEKIRDDTLQPTWGFSNYNQIPNGSRVIVWHSTSDSRNNTPYYDSAISSRWGDYNFRVSASVPTE